MRLLIITQVVDIHHPVLGFFHRWIIEFAKHVEHLHVIALQVGEYDLPENVTVHSLGKEGGAGRLEYIRRFYSYILGLRNEYDNVFVHMNVEYVVLAGVFWRLLSKRVGLWYMHKNVDFKLRVAEIFTNYIFTATPSSFRLSSRKINYTGHGIDVELFSPDPSIKRYDHALSVGRLMKTKRHDLVIAAAGEAKKSVHIIGEGSERDVLERLALEQGVAVKFLGGLSQEKLVEEYQKAEVLVHTSETGSLDKVVLEALACGCPVVTTNENYLDMPILISEPSPKLLAETLSKPFSSDMYELHEYVGNNHSLKNLIVKITNFYV